MGIKYGVLFFVRKRNLKIPSEKQSLSNFKLKYSLKMLVNLCTFISFILVAESSKILDKNDGSWSTICAVIICTFVVIDRAESRVGRRRRFAWFRGGTASKLRIDVSTSTTATPIPWTAIKGSKKRGYVSKLASRHFSHRPTNPRMQSNLLAKSWKGRWLHCIN